MGIPKVIHYIWFGGKEEPAILLKCKESWKKYCPDFEIKRWDESNLDINKYQFAKDAYDAKKWAFASDVFRFDILEKEGGVYFDTDVELMKPIDDFLKYDFFTGFEDVDFINPGLIMGSVAHHPVLQEIIDIYKNAKFDIERLDLITICQFTTKHLNLKYGIKIEDTTQIKDNIAIFSTDYFCPINYRTKKKTFTPNTVSIHHYAASWVPKKTFKQKVKDFVKKCIKFCIGKKNYEKLKNKVKGNNNG